MIGGDSTGASLGLSFLIWAVGAENRPHVSQAGSFLACVHHDHDVKLSP